MYARVLQITKKQVYCDCLVDENNKIFETKKFPKTLFKNIKNKSLLIIEQDDLILDGSGLINPIIFEVDDIFEELKNSGLDKPIVFDND